MFKKWFENFWNGHGERLVFAIFALGLATILYYSFDMKGEAKTIYVGIAMLFFNKVRGTNGIGKTTTPAPKEDKKNEKV